jgi:hypothetical protein
VLRSARRTFGQLIDHGTDYLFAGLYWVATRLLRPKKVGGLQLLDVRGASEEDEAYLLRCFGEALEMISSVRAGFGELVTGHLRLVVVSGTAWDIAAPTARAYITPFGQHSRSNSQYLACRLIWAATWIRLVRDMDAQGRRRDYDFVQRAAVEAQLRFVQQFPDPAEWEEYLRRSPRGSHRQAGA